MTDNFEDLEHHEHEHNNGDDMQPPVGLRANLAEAWRTRPIVKLLVVMVVAGAFIAAAVSFFSSSKQEPMTRLANPPDIHQPPGGKASPYFLQQTEKAEIQREKEALAQGGSSIPTPIGRDNDLNPNDKEDPLKELKAETSRLKVQLAQMQQTQAQPAQGQNQQPERFDESLAQAMQQQMHQLMDSWVPKGIKEVSVTPKDSDGSKDGKNGANGAGAANGAANAANAAAQAAPKTIVPAGTVSYAQLLVEANSDVPGPILALIVSGPLSGARAIGSFQIANGYNDYLVLHFTHANWKGRDYSMDAYALDPDTTLTGMATEVDQRYLTRVILPAAAGFLQGLGSALGQNNQTTTVTDGLAIVSQPKVGLDQGIAQGMGQAAQVASQFFQNQANQTRPLVRVASGTPMGLFFVSSVVDTTNLPLPGTMGVAGQGYPPGYPAGMPGMMMGQQSYPAGYGMPYGAGAAGGYPGATNVGYGGYSTQGSGSGVPYPNPGGGPAVNNFGGGTGMGYGTGYGAAPRYTTPGTYSTGQGLVP